MKLILFLCEAAATCLPPFLLAVGLFLLYRLRGFPLFHPVRLAGCLRGAGRGSVQSLLLSLAGTLGVGNIAGVGVALSIGGEGAVLWLFLGGLVATVLKYAEVCLALDARPKERASRGALDYITPALGRGAGLAFAILTLILSLVMGSVLQGGVIAEALAAVLPIAPLSSGLMLTALTLLLFLGGRRAVEGVTRVLIPPLTILYCASAILVILFHAGALPAVLGRILRGALLPQSIGGGALGVGVTRAMRAGIGTGLFSNEAGAGTAPFAHGGAAATPAVQGIFGIIEVAIDTLLMCTLTALAVLCALDPLPPLSGTALVAAAFGSVFGEGAEIILTLSVVLFSCATVACWGSYGSVAVSHLSPSRGIRALYALLFSLCLTAGALLGAGEGFTLCDGVLAGMCFINLTALWRCIPRIRRITEDSGLIGERQ